MFKKISLTIILMGVLLAGISKMSFLQPTIFKYRHYYYKLSQPNNVNELLRRAYQTFNVPKDGIIHIGARYAEELKFYRHHGIKNILWIEADPEAQTQLSKAIAKHPGSRMAIFAATDKNGYIDLHKTSNDGHSSSILKLKNHAIYYPSITEAKVLHVPQYRLDDYLLENNTESFKYNVLVMDIQGAELIALKGALKTLENIDAIVTETNYNELYAGASIITQLDTFLIENDFIRVDSASCTSYTGDALYVKSKYLT